MTVTGPQDLGPQSKTNVIAVASCAVLGDEVKDRDEGSETYASGDGGGECIVHIFDWDEQRGRQHYGRKMKTMK